MNWVRTNWRKLLIVVLLLNLMGSLFVLGRLTGRQAATEANDAAAIQAAESHQAGKTTFCALSERAKFYTCPSMRKAMPYGGGIVVLYVCDLGGTKGYLEMMRVPAEAKTQVIAKFLESGFKAEPSCGTSDDEVLTLTKVPWKTASY